MVQLYVYLFGELLLSASLLALTFIWMAVVGRSNENGRRITNIPYTLTCTGFGVCFTGLAGLLVSLILSPAWTGFSAVEHWNTWYTVLRLGSLALLLVGSTMLFALERKLYSLSIFIVLSLAWAAKVFIFLT